MKTSIPVAAIIAILAGASVCSAPAFAADRPCEDVLTELRAAKTTAKPDADTMKKVEALEAKGVERCNADDDRRADAFFADALKLLGK